MRINFAFFFVFTLNVSSYLIVGKEFSFHNQVFLEFASLCKKGNLKKVVLIRDVSNFVIFFVRKKKVKADNSYQKKSAKLRLIFWTKNELDFRLYFFDSEVF